jgi:hypothetical protein
MTGASSFAGHVLDCSLAKPHTDQKPSGGPNSQNSSLYSNFPPQLGYGLAGGTYGGFGAGFGAAGFTQVSWCSIVHHTHTHTQHSTAQHHFDTWNKHVYGGLLGFIKEQNIWEVCQHRKSELFQLFILWFDAEEFVSFLFISKQK